LNFQQSQDADKIVPDSEEEQDIGAAENNDSEDNFSGDGQGDCGDGNEDTEQEDTKQEENPVALSQGLGMHLDDFDEVEFAEMACNPQANTNFEEPEDVHHSEYVP
jgi:hypothetical protein